MEHSQAAAVPAPAPFIIWTLRRTGGTNFGHALILSSPFEHVEHEPFNHDRVFGHVTCDWNRDHDEQALHRAIEAIVARQVLIKHCVETVPEALNNALAQASIAAGYRHLFLYRRCARDRLLSLVFAQRSGAWSREQASKLALQEAIYREPLPVERLVADEQHCRNTLRAVYSQLRELGTMPLGIAFEDIYLGADPRTTRQQVHALLCALGLSRGEAQDGVLLEQVLARGEQGTRDRYRQFADHDKLDAALRALGEFELA